MLKNIFYLLLAFPLISACASSDIFDPLGENISTPNSMFINSDTNRLYLINSNANVLYDWEQGSMQVIDITNPTTPQLLNTVQTQSFSGEIYMNPDTNLLYTSNRFSSNSTVNEDNLLIINVDESSDSFLTVNDTTTSKDPYGLACCYPDNRLWIATQEDAIQYKDLTDISASGGSISLLRTLSNTYIIENAETSYIIINGTQAFVPRNRGGLFVINLDEVDDSSANPVDYFIEDISYPTGLATDGTYIYQTSIEEIDGEWKSVLLILDPSSLTPVTDNTTTEVIDKDTSGLLIAQVIVADSPQQVLLTSNYAFITCAGDNIVSVVDISTPASATKVKDITVGEDPFSMSLYSPANIESYIYVGNVESNTISIIDINTLALATTYP